MAFSVNLYTFSKRDNSTKRPSGDGTAYSCVMKHGCGVLNPQISLDLGINGNPSSYNYARINAFGRYYFIEEWYFEDALWTASLKVDVLATYKNEIGNSNLYVLRSSARSDGRITDLLYPAKTGCNFARETKANPWTGVSYIVGVVGSNATYGSIQYYVLGAGQMTTLCSNLLDREQIISEDYGFDPTEFADGLQLSLVDPLQYIKSCILLPVDYTELTNLGDYEDVKVFNWDPNVGGIAVKPHTRVTKSYEFAIPQHPDTNSRGDYVNSAPFTSLTLTIPPFGCLDIDTSVTANASILRVEIDIDPISGKGILVVKCNNIVLNRIEAQIGVPISISSVTRDYVGGVSATAGAVGSIAGGIMSGSVGEAVLGATSGIGNAIQSMMPRAQTMGSTGSFVSNRGEFRLDAQFFRPINDDNAHNGRPYCRVVNLATLGGYMLIQDGDVSIDGTSSEDSLIRDYLESGFYYE